MNFHIVMHTRNSVNLEDELPNQIIILATSKVATYFYIYVDLIDSALHVTSTSDHASINQGIHEISYFLKSANSHLVKLTFL